MKLKSFLKLVEIQTKVASVIPLLLGILFCSYRYQVFKPGLILLFLISMLCVDMSTTALNNLVDYRKAIKREGYNYEEHNAMVKDGIHENTAVAAIVMMLLIGVATGFALFLLTDWVILLVGAIGFFVGILYSYGPLPISRTPLGELFSGLVMGGLIYFVAIYMQIYQNGLVIAYMRGAYYNLQVNLVELSIIGFTALPLIFMIAGIMLANNICDVEDDIHNKRFTLPYFIGRELSLKLFALLYLGSFAVVIAGVLFNLLPVINLLVVVSAIPIVQNLKSFFKEQNKATTFIVSVKNFVLFSGIWMASFGLNSLIEVFV
ncbi:MULTISPECIES: 1,4-dihydroxy-2-naphthoate polyprenyltransferase [unclassified Fusibacter]|uniref:1,4-dihydroxy-2-naphthoate polyprenyltransferase n=1 Tax=unclassified Fusibacter TaxID=2624464 RepID=UPI0013E954CB|nr:MULTISPECIES: 1,4-dihydroxy-2-naphthoate polyprenyltransferase [unclassified Fusibacter]MCK8059689.1 1,4-dihydroxy-2-naphthoate polyprenyltransferase [Fusibacter sp. A2]NPE21490.1 1,4-dihydroxy-2-naphthoate polyprenyltransferase [Fusibacter sp. A1]